MPSFTQDELKELFLFQSWLLDILAQQNLPFCLTGGAALSRYYLHHRYHYGIHLRAWQDPMFHEHFLAYLEECINRGAMFTPLLSTRDTHYHLIMNDGAQGLPITYKLENQEPLAPPLKARAPSAEATLLVEHPLDILVHKLHLLMARENPTDIADIVVMAANWSFHWGEIFEAAKIPPEFAAERIRSANPATFLAQILRRPWKRPESAWKRVLATIVEDLAKGAQNSMGQYSAPIEQAEIVSYVEGVQYNITKVLARKLMGVQRKEPEWQDRVVTAKILADACFEDDPPDPFELVRTIEAGPNSERRGLFLRLLERTCRTDLIIAAFGLDRVQRLVMRTDHEGLPPMTTMRLRALRNVLCHHDDEIPNLSWGRVGRLIERGVAVSIWDGL